MDYGSYFIGVIKFFKKGDYISLKIVYLFWMWVLYVYIFFGVYKI